VVCRLVLVAIRLVECCTCSPTVRRARYSLYFQGCFCVRGNGSSCTFWSWPIQNVYAGRMFAIFVVSMVVVGGVLWRSVASCHQS